MTKQEIIKTLTDYVNNDKAKYAVLLDGTWGSGKTYLYETILRDTLAKLEYGKNEGKGNVYISLYGISTVEQLSKELIINYFLEVKLHGDKCKGNVYKKISKIIGIVSKSISFSIGTAAFDIDGGMEKFNQGIDIKNMVICFDDLERCSIPINDLFGMINTLVEHCNCKVIILADEKNIGKMYANTNIEAKYLTLLMGRKLGVNTKDQGHDDKLTVQELKQLNEKIYSENYLYRDIKEKVIGLTLYYVPDLEEEFDSIIENTVSNIELSNRLKTHKEDILQYMKKCDNNNIRIMKVWLVNFEKIFSIIYIKFSKEKFFEEIFNRLAIYTVRVACAIGKNKKLAEWQKGIEVGFIDLDDKFFLKKEGYSFVDDLFLNGILDEERVIKVANYIITDKENEEQAEREANKGKTYKKLNEWYYLEDDEIKDKLPLLLKEIKNNEYIFQNYQRILSLLIILKKEGYCDNQYMLDVCQAMENTIKSTHAIIKVENIQEQFADEEELQKEFHEYYVPLYSLIVTQNRSIDKDKIDQELDYSTGENFYNWCRKNYSSFIEKGSFISYVNLNALKNIIYTGTIKDIYNISSGIDKIYNSNNLYEVFPEDVNLLVELKKHLEKNEVTGNTRRKAIQRLITTLENKIDKVVK